MAGTETRAEDRADAARANRAEPADSIRRRLLSFNSTSAAARRSRSRSRNKGLAFLRAFVSSANLARISRGSTQDARRSTTPRARFFLAAARALASRMRRTVFSKPGGAPPGRRGGAGDERRAPRGSQGLRASATDDARTPFRFVASERLFAKYSESRLMRGANVHSASSRASASSRDVRRGGFSTRSPVTAENADGGAAASRPRRSARGARGRKDAFGRHVRRAAAAAEGRRRGIFLLRAGR